MSVPAELNEASVGETDDALLALVSSILSGIPVASIEDVKLSNIYIETVGGATAVKVEPLSWAPVRFAA